MGLSWWFSWIQAFSILAKNLEGWIWTRRKKVPADRDMVSVSLLFLLMKLIKFIFVLMVIVILSKCFVFCFETSFWERRHCSLVEFHGNARDENVILCREIMQSVYVASYNGGSTNYPVFDSIFFIFSNRQKNSSRRMQMQE